MEHGVYAGFADVRRTQIPRVWLPLCSDLKIVFLLGRDGHCWKMVVPEPSGRDNPLSFVRI